MKDNNEHFPPRFLKDLWSIQESIADELSGLSLHEIGLEIHHRADDTCALYAKQIELGELPVPVIVTRNIDAFPPKVLRDHWAETEASARASAASEDPAKYPDTSNWPPA